MALDLDGPSRHRSRAEWALDQAGKQPRGASGVRWTQRGQLVSARRTGRGVLCPGRASPAASGQSPLALPGICRWRRGGNCGADGGWRSSRALCHLDLGSLSPAGLWFGADRETPAGRPGGGPGDRHPPGRTRWCRGVRTTDLSMGFLSESNPLAIAGIALLAVLLLALALWYWRTDPSVRLLLGSLAAKDSSAIFFLRGLFVPNNELFSRAPEDPRNPSSGLTVLKWPKIPELYTVPDVRAIAELLQLALATNSRLSFQVMSGETGRQTWSEDAIAIGPHYKSLQILDACEPKLVQVRQPPAFRTLTVVRAVRGEGRPRLRTDLQRLPSGESSDLLGRDGTERFGDRGSRPFPPCPRQVARAADRGRMPSRRSFRWIRRRAGRERSSRPYSPSRPGGGGCCMGSGLNSSRRHLGLRCE